MEDRSVIHSTFVIERNYPAPPERVFAAFADPARKRRWFVEGEGHEVEHYELDFRTGGKERARFRFKEDTPLKGIACTNDGSFLDIVPNRRIVTASTMAVGEKCISASLVTFEFMPSETGLHSSSRIREHSSRAPMVLKCVKRDGASCSTV